VTDLPSLPHSEQTEAALLAQLTFDEDAAQQLAEADSAQAKFHAEEGWRSGLAHCR